MRQLALIIYFFLVAIADAALPCSPNQWCWQRGWSKEYIALPTTSASFADAAAMCSSMSASVMTGDQEAASALAAFAAANAGTDALTWWTALALSAVNGLVVRPTLEPVSLTIPPLNLTMADPCYADASCCFALRLSGVFGEACPSRSNWSVMCVRTGAPSAWVTTAVSEMEYGLFARLGNFSEASEACASVGGSLAYFPTPPSLLRQALMARLGSAAMGTNMWIGFSTNVVGASIWQAVPGTVEVPSVPFSPSPAQAGKCGALSSTGQFSRSIACSTSQPFLCQRLSVASNKSAFCNASSGTLYRFFPAITSPDGPRQGVTPSQAIAQCQSTGGEMTKFANTSELSACFDSAAAFLTTCYSSGVWGDLSLAAVPPFFANATGLCTFFNASGPSPGTMLCTSYLANVCEYAPSTIISASLSIGNVTVGPRCSVAVAVTLNRPPAWNESVSICRVDSSPPDCFQWASLSLTVSIVVRGEDFPSGFRAFYTLKCTPVTLCSTDPLPLDILIRNAATNVSLGKLIASSGTTTPAGFQGIVGAPLRLPPLVVSSNTTFNVSATFAIVGGINSANCSVFPPSALFHGLLADVTLTVFCDAGSSSAMTFAVTANIESADSASCCVDRYTAVPVASVTIVRNLSLSISNASYFGFGPNPVANVTLPVLSGYLGPRWICARFLASNVTGAAGKNVCVSSQAPYVTASLDITPPTVSLQSFVLTYIVTGNAALHVRTSLINVTVLLLPMTVTLDCGLSTIPQYVNLTFAVRALLPFPVRANYNVTIVGNPWSGPVISLPSVLNLSTPQSLRIIVPVGQLEGWIVYLPNRNFADPSARWNNLDTEGLVVVEGNASHLFNRKAVSAEGYCRSVGRLVISSASALNYTQLPLFLFYNSPPYPINVSIPAQNPLRNQTFSLALVCASCPAGSIVITPPSLTFTSGSETSQALRLSVLLPLQNVQLSWSFIGQMPVQYLAPPPFVLSSRNQSSLRPMVQVQQLFFTNTVYSLRIIARAPPPQSNVSVMLKSPGPAAMVSAAVFNTTNEMIQVLRFYVMSVGSLRSVALELVLGGDDFSAFYLESSAVTVSPVYPQINVSLKNVPIFLLNTTVPTVGTVTVSLDRPPLSYIVTIEFSTSIGLTVRPAILFWLSSNSSQQTVTLSSTTVSNADAFFSHRVVSTMIDGTNTNETALGLSWCNSLGECKESRNGTVQVPVLFQNTYSLLPALRVLPMRIGDKLNFSLSIGRPPYIGNVTFRFSGAFTTWISVTPNSLFFDNSNVTSKQFSVTALSPTTVGKLVPQLEGAGSVFFVAPVALCFFVDKPVSPTLSLEGLLGSVMVVGQASLNASCGLSMLDDELCTAETTPILPRQLPVNHTELTVTLSTLPTGAVQFTPSVVRWRAGESLLRRVVVAPTGSVVGPVVVRLNTSGNATTYTNATYDIVIRHRSNISIRFPTEGAYPMEKLAIAINISSPPVVCTSTLIADVELQCLTATCLEAEVDYTKSLEFTCSSLAEQTILLSMNVVRFLTELKVSVLFSGTASGEYSWNQTVTSSTITFLPRRTATISFPEYIFVSSPLSFNVSLSAAPDTGATLLFRAFGYQLSQVIFSSTSPTTQSISIIAPYLQESGFFNLTLSASSPFQTNRYEPVRSIFLTVREKVTLSPFMSATLRTSQVIGRLNNQSVTFKANKVPIFPFTTTITAISSVSTLLVFDPPSCTFTPQDTDLTRTVHIWGAAAGTASDLRFVLSGFMDELSEPDPDHAILPSSLRILPLQTVRFNGTFSVMYVGTENSRNFSLYLSRECNLPVIVSLNFSFSWAAKIEPSVLVFTPEAKTQILNATITGTNATTGEILVSLLSGPEFSPVIDGFMQVIIIPRISVSVFRSGTLIAPNSTIHLISDTFTTFDLSVSSTDLRYDGLYNLTLVKGPLAAECARSCYGLVNDSFVFPSAESIAMGSRESRLFVRSFGIAAAAKVADTFRLVITTQDRPMFEPGFDIYCNVAPEPVLNISAPAVLFDGPLNAKSFLVGISHVTPGEMYTYSLTSASCDSVSVQAARELSFSEALQAPVQITISGNFTGGPCVFFFRKLSHLSSESFLSFPPDFFLDARVEISIRRSPQVIFLNASSSGAPTVLPFRLVQRSTQLLLADITFGRLRSSGNITYAIVDVSDEASMRAAQQAVDIIISTPAGLAAEPRGLLFVRNLPGLFVFDTSNATRFSMRIGPAPELLLVSSTVVTVMLTNRIFSEGQFANSSAHGFVFVIERYIASIVSAADLIAVGTLTAGAVSLMPLASPVLLPHLFKPNALLQMFSCPNGQWFLDIWPFPKLLSEPETLPTWLMISVVSTGTIVALTVSHGVIVTVVYIYRRSTRSTEVTVTQAGAAETQLKTTFSGVAGDFHFPAAPLSITLAFAAPILTFSLSTLFYSSLPSYRIISFLCSFLTVVVIPVCIHGIVWRSRSLVFIPYVGGRKWFLPIGFWDHPTSATYLARYWPLFSDLRNNFRWYVLADYSVMMILSATIAVQPSSQSGCVAKVTMAALLVLIQLIGTLLLQPYRFLFLSYAMGLVLALQFAGLVMLAHQVNQRLRDDAAQIQSLQIFTASAALMLLVSIFTIVARCVPHESKVASRTRFYAAREFEKEPEEDLDAPTNPAPPPPVHVSDSDMDADPEAVRLAEELSQIRAGQHQRRPVGRFRASRNSQGYRKGSEHSFSPLRRVQLRELDTLAEVAPALVLPEVSEALSPELRPHPWAFEPSPESSPELSAGASQKPKDEKKVCRFVESSELL